MSATNDHDDRHNPRRAECIAKAAEEMKVEPFKGPFSAEPYDSARWFVADGLRRAVSPLISEEAAQWLCDRLNAAPARDAAPIAGESACLFCNCTDMGTWRDSEAAEGQQWYFVCGNCGARGPAAEGPSECRDVFLARAALPSGGGAREAAVQIVDEICSAIGKHLGYEMTLDRRGVYRETEAIITKHIPSAPAGLTETEQSIVDQSWRSIGREPKHQTYNVLSGRMAAALLDTITRLTGGQKP